jgi:hypothetical protein
MNVQLPNLARSLAMKAASSILLCASLAGCGADITSPFLGAGSGQTFKNLSGNWEITLTPSVGPVPFNTLAGYIDERSAATAAGVPVSASLQLTGPSLCFAGSLLIPASGQLLKNQLGLYSFTIDGQYFDTTSTVNSTATSLTGTYVVEDGCAGNLASAGLIVGTHYADLTGHFLGSQTASTQDLQITLDVAQVAAGNSDGTFDTSGTIILSGLACYAEAPLASNSGSVIGSSVHLVFSDAATDSQIRVEGVFDPTAHALTLNSINILGGSCAGSLGPIALTRQ